jgi:hypothetical protein
MPWRYFGTKRMKYTSVIGEGLLENLGLAQIIIPINPKDPLTHA